jgi:hypothetical protein
MPEIELATSWLDTLIRGSRSKSSDFKTIDSDVDFSHGHAVSLW